MAMLKRMGLPLYTYIEDLKQVTLRATNKSPWQQSRHSI